jgi:putative salt-induced outer membrane protein
LVSPHFPDKQPPVNPLTLPLVAIAIGPVDVPRAPREEVPAELRAMLEAAIASGNEGEVNTLVKYARAAKVPAADAMNRQAEAWKRDRRASAERRLREADFLALVKGRVEVSGFRTEGNTDNIGVSGRLDLRREGLRWRHKLIAQADYQESFGITSRERYLVAWEPNYKFHDRLYAYGAAQYESDPFLGYITRYSVSSGLGYSAIRKTGMRLDVELGPAFRQTDFTDDRYENNVAARGSLDFNWKMTPSITFRQNASAYIQDANSTVASTTAVSAKVLGPLSTQLSYVVQYESLPPFGRQTTDTTSRASVVYEF